MAAQEDTEQVLPTFFLDTFPKELLDNVLRFFSRIPKAKKWERHIPLLDLVPLFRVKGQVETMMKSRFTALCVSRSGDCITEVNSWHWSPPHEGTLSTNDINIARTYVLAGGGHALRTLAIGLRMYKQEKDGVDIVDDFANNCPNVTSLSAHDTGLDWPTTADERGSAWVARFGKQLKKLELSTGTTDGISRYCQSLEEINLHVLNSDMGDDDLWENIGGNLEKLTYKSVHGELAVHFQKIGRHCKKLRHIDIDEGYARPAEKSQLLCSYGEQLQFAGLYFTDERQIRDIVNACKNARFQLKSILDTPILPLIRILKHQLESIDFRFDFEERDYHEFEKAWDGCINLRRVRVEGCLVDDMKALMATPKMHLEYLIIRLFPCHEKIVKQVLDVCPSGYEHVEEFEYNGPEPPLDAFQKFIENNKSSCGSISLVIYSDSMKREKYLELIEPFTNAGVSIELSIYGESDNILGELIDRGVTVRGGYGIPCYTA